MRPYDFLMGLNVGTDIVHLPRIARLLARPAYLSRFTRRILHDQEQQDFRARFKHIFQETPSSHAQPHAPITITKEMTRWLAGRFAAKEAARKAARNGAASLGWKDVIVQLEAPNESLQTRSGSAEGVSRRPEIVYLDEAGGPGTVGRLSISHDGDYVVATVLAAD